MIWIDLPDDIRQNVVDRLEIDVVSRLNALAPEEHKLPLSEDHDKLLIIERAIQKRLLHPTIELARFVAESDCRYAAGILSRMGDDVCVKKVRLERAIRTRVYGDASLYPTAEEYRKHFNVWYDLVRETLTRATVDQFDRLSDTPHFLLLMRDEQAVNVFMGDADPVLAEHFLNRIFVGDKLRFTGDISAYKSRLLTMPGYEIVRQAGHLDDARWSRYLTYALSHAAFDVVNAISKDGYRLDGPRIPPARVPLKVIGRTDRTDRTDRRTIAERGPHTVILWQSFIAEMVMLAMAAFMAACLWAMNGQS